MPLKFQISGCDLKVYPGPGVYSELSDGLGFRVEVYQV